jgi:hypothetical protein
MKKLLNPFQRVFAMSLGIHSKVGCATHESFANSITQVWGNWTLLPIGGFGTDRSNISLRPSTSPTFCAR